MFVAMPNQTSSPKGGAKCSSCEAVCCRLTVVLQPEDRVPDYLTTYSPEGLHVMQRGKEGWCVALNSTNMNCGIYENRPSVCRRFVMNGPYCKAVRAEYSDPAAASARHASAA
ncbi:YkgJ family cysteine cluster protein [Dyella jiangningensis]|uniref:Zinc/iron-chelating domain-containing protein n=1 Tax=Dyella jiangningensis TaxID=1379159 RepID=A0A328PG30_9GAMM|nr:YkgJ family cysteine cluster protein [Dyella jiangningensis]RAO78384.1 zinc/iron-chelating domain-containing protein [Dyella jiangningensis]